MLDMRILFEGSTVLTEMYMLSEVSNLDEFMKLMVVMYDG